ncbi:MAG: hypothetical protein KKD01_13810 [Proteobacteria bacterium]|nr:hypothetical protein [Pseudomonadota bacterium]MBU1233363.1 hypothetical protein [Pseudomonadota bacterium]MBU1420597.1 hypothetical protein [Pseudomonadota bacterium]MBU1455796.1 hypothetical protein [Pseudomonadota bacterium]
MYKAIGSQSPMMHSNLGKPLHQSGAEDVDGFNNLQQANRLALKAIELSKERTSPYLKPLASAYAELAEFNKAFESQTKEIGLLVKKEE